MDVHVNIDVTLDVIASSTRLFWDLGHFSSILQFWDLWRDM